jgi:hypothetical protein
LPIAVRRAPCIIATCGVAVGIAVGHRHPLRG